MMRLIINKQAAFLTGSRMAIAGFFAYCLMYWSAVPEGIWTVVTVSAVTRPSLGATSLKALLRVFGTLVGAALGYILGFYFYDNAIAIFFLFSLLLTLTSYIGLQTKPYNYAAVVTGFTAVIVLSAKVLGNEEYAALFRTLNVLLGIAIVAVVGAVFSLFGPHLIRHSEKPSWEKIKLSYTQIHPSSLDFYHALRVSLTASMTFLFWQWFHYPYGYWVTITVLIIMEDSLGKTWQKSWLRLIGQLLAASYGLVAVLVFNDSVVLMGSALVIGFFISGAIIGSGWCWADMGNHAGSAIAIMLLLGLETHSIEVVWARFVMVVAGIFIANMVLKIPMRRG